MKLIKWIVIIGIIIAGMFLIKGIAGHEQKHVQKINAQHAEKAEQYTTGIAEHARQQIDKDVQQGYKGLPMSPSQQ